MLYGIQYSHQASELSSFLPATRRSIKDVDAQSNCGAYRQACNMSLKEARHPQILSCESLFFVFASIFIFFGSCCGYHFSWQYSALAGKDELSAGPMSCHLTETHFTRSSLVHTTLNALPEQPLIYFVPFLCNINLKGQPRNPPPWHTADPQTRHVCILCQPISARSHRS